MHCELRRPIDVIIDLLISSNLLILIEKQIYNPFIPSGMVYKPWIKIINFAYTYITF